MEALTTNDTASGTASAYHLLPFVPEHLVDRDFLLKDDNVEITSMDIASHGSYLVAGSSSGMILLFDLTNPSAQTDGLLIGQIRARGMHTNLIVTVKFSEDGRFVFAGVSKGSSEMLAIDLGKVLVDWNSANNSLAVSRGSSDALQQLQLSSMVTFSFSDAKLRGFGAVVRMDVPSNSGSTGGSSAFKDSSALYRLACGRGIKNVHIWHFRVGYLEDPQSQCAGEEPSSRQLHGKWEYVCDVASNGNTITHIEFRQAGNELLSKSAGMCIRLWDLQSSSRLAEDSKDGPAVQEGEAGAISAAEASTAPTAATTPAAGTAATGYVMLKPSYVDIANSQDVKCMLPVGTGAYGGTYQFAVLNTSAPREANRDVLELPERFSGDAAVVATSGAAGTGTASALIGGGSGGGPNVANSAFLPAGRGRRITREIEQVICTDEGKHALILCADGGVVYYNAPSASSGEGLFKQAAAAESEGNCEGEEPGSAQSSNSSSSGSSGGAGQLVELGALYRPRDQQQHTGSWALRRVGRQGAVVLLRASSGAAVGAGVTVEVRQLSVHVTGDADDCVMRAQAQAQADARSHALACTVAGSTSQGTEPQKALYYYQDPSEHEAQRALRRAWVAAAAPGAKRQQGQSSTSAAKRPKPPASNSSSKGLPDTPSVSHLPVSSGVGVAASDSAPRKRKALSIQDVSDNRSPGRQRPAPPSARRSSSSGNASGGDAEGTKYVTPAAAQASSARHNRISPSDDADRLASYGHSSNSGLDQSYVDNGSVSPTASPRARSGQGSLGTGTATSSNSNSRGSRQPGSSASATLARLRALRDDEDPTADACTAAADEQDQSYGQGPALRDIKPGKRNASELQYQIRKELPALLVGPAPKVHRVAVIAVKVPEPALPSAPPMHCPPSELGTGCRLQAAGAALIEKWLTSCSAVSPALASASGGALVGAALSGEKQQQQQLGVCALERLGVILMEQDRVKALFQREVCAAFRTLLLQQASAAQLAAADVVGPLVSRYRELAGEVVQRQQLDLQGACAVDAVVRGGFTAGASLAGGTSSCWGDSLKVCYRHEGVFEQALQLQGTLRGLLLDTSA